MILQSRLPTYQMRWGDTLYSVARRHGITTRELMAVNPGLSPHSLRIGATVRVPYPGISARAASAARGGWAQASDPAARAPSVEIQGFEAPHDAMPGEAAQDGGAPKVDQPAPEASVEQHVGDESTACEAPAEEWIDPQPMAHEAPAEEPADPQTAGFEAPGAEAGE